MPGIVLESRTSVLVVLEQRQLKKIDAVAGSGNRSGYIRWLIDSVNESNIKRELELEAMVKVLQKLPDQMQKRIVKRDLKIAELKKRNKDLKQGKPEEKDIEGLEEIYKQYSSWRNDRLGYNYGSVTASTRKWCEFRAKKVDMDVDELARMLEEKYGKESGDQLAEKYREIKGR